MANSAGEFFTALAERGFEPLFRSVRGTYGFDVQGAGHWHMTVDDGRVTAREGQESTDCIVTISEEDFVAATRGERNLLTLAMQGRVEIRGDLRLAQAFHVMVRAGAGAREEHTHG